MQGQVILVVVLGREEARVSVGARDDRSVEDLRFVDLGDVGVGDILLNVVLREDRGSILFTDVGALAVQLGRVVDDGEEDAEQLSEAHLAGVVGDLYGLGVPGGTRPHRFVLRGRCLTAGIAGYR